MSNSTNNGISDGTSTPWQRAVEDGADALGDMMIELADGRAEHTPDDMAAAVLALGIGRLATEPPEPARVTAAAKALFHALHGVEADWPAAEPAQRRFLEDTARAMLAAADPLLAPVAAG
jgi:hypothetical protein